MFNICCVWCLYFFMFTVHSLFDLLYPLSTNESVNFCLFYCPFLQNWPCRWRRSSIVSSLVSYFIDNRVLLTLEGWSSTSTNISSIGNPWYFLFYAVYGWMPNIQAFLTVSGRPAGFRMDHLLDLVHRPTLQSMLNRNIAHHFLLHSAKPIGHRFSLSGTTQAILQ